MHFDFAANRCVVGEGLILGSRSFSDFLLSKPYRHR